MEPERKAENKASYSITVLTVLKIQTSSEINAPQSAAGPHNFQSSEKLILFLPVSHWFSWGENFLSSSFQHLLMSGLILFLSNL